MPHLRFQLPKRVTKKFNSSRSPKKCIEIRRLETNPISLGQQHQRAVLSFVEVLSLPAMPLAGKPAGRCVPLEMHRL
jgi:hypothetical protein